MRVIALRLRFEVSADAGHELVEVAQAHAREMHGMELPAELVLALARAASRGRPPRIRAMRTAPR
ncbi:MAG: hypothetical protein AVDCRST_MAG10-2593 [uncultured Acidimicrobiales bacterium]|uniref:DUF1059 domain-containing protein n=1 Tax=uncultured Acidimicrobiales bacterium TaxID=310071 RepID=A0A6J4IPB9_9ACTN|nr:MAG: hypothetical protein AVDCRST_MAG10-2593 [uncultured Acidimicrobiales bacterium]